MSNYAFIFARGGSKGLPGKNIIPLAGKPLIAHAIECAKACPSVSKVIVSTDCEKIAAVSESYGAEIPFLRPPELASDKADEIDAWKHAVNYYLDKGEKFDTFLSLPATAPLRIPDDVERALNKLDANPEGLIISYRQAERSPFFNMVKYADDKGQLKLFSESSGFTRRQDCPEAFDMTTVVYAAKAPTVMGLKSIWDVNVYGIEIPKERSVDIDDIWDFKFAEFLLTGGLHNEDL